MDELPDALHEQIKALSAQGDQLASEAEYQAALSKYNEAWQLVPEPKTDWRASTWVLAAIGDACFLGRFFATGAEALRDAMHCPGGFGNPFIHMRLGQCELELGNEPAATDNLLRAYALEGKRIYSAEDPKYFQYLQAKIAPPASGVW